MVVFVAQCVDSKILVSEATSVVQHPAELRGTKQTVRSRKPEAGDRYQALSLARPLARRARITARPPGVAMRARNPWVRFLFSSLG